MNTDKGKRQGTKRCDSSSFCVAGWGRVCSPSLYLLSECNLHKPICNTSKGGCDRYSKVYFIINMMSAPGGVPLTRSGKGGVVINDWWSYIGHYLGGGEVVHISSLRISWAELSFSDTGYCFLIRREVASRQQADSNRTRTGLLATCSPLSHLNNPPPHHHHATLFYTTF